MSLFDAAVDLNPQQIEAALFALQSPLSKELEKQQRRQRQEIFKAEDEIMERRDSLIESLERRLAQHTETDALFTIRWAVQ